MHITRDPRIRLRLTALEDLVDAQLDGEPSDSRRAALLGVERTSYLRVKHGKTLPSSQFVAAVLISLPGSRFEDLFEPITTAGSEA